MKRAIFTLLLLLLITQSAFGANLDVCKDSNDFSSIGNCIIRQGFGGDYLLFAIIMILIFSIFLWQAQMPVGASIAISLILVFSLISFMPGTGTLLLNLIILLIGLLIGFTILRYTRG